MALPDGKFTETNLIGGSKDPLSFKKYSAILQDVGRDYNISHHSEAFRIHQEMKEDYGHKLIADNPTLIEDQGVYTEYYNGFQFKRDQIACQIADEYFLRFPQQKKDFDERYIGTLGLKVVRDHLKGILENDKLRDKYEIWPLEEEMENIRDEQLFNDPESPENLSFAQHFLDDIRAELGLKKGGDIQVRYYSAQDKIIDYAGGVDFWVELYNTRTKKVLYTYNVDVTSNLTKKQNWKQYRSEPGRLARYIFFYDKKNADGAIKDDLFKSGSYLTMLNAVRDTFLYIIRDKVNTVLS